DLLTVVGTDGALWVKEGKANWRSMGGKLIEAPLFVEGYYDDYFLVVGTDRNVWIRTWNQGWRPFGPRGTDCVGAGAEASWKRLAVACRGADNALWGATVETRDAVVPGVTGWRSFGGRMKHGASIADITDGAYPRHAYVVVGTDNKPWVKADGEGWQKISDGRCGGTVAVSTFLEAMACRNDASDALRIFHFESGTDGRLLDSGIVGKPAVTVDPDGVTRYYVLGRDRSIWTATQRADGRVGAFTRTTGAGVHGLSAYSLT
ncbi:MAG TPA: hypothetical protein VM433_02295, partial [Mycobacteriales bacterium]|nr:hypothetical protein [Mycobacteriales bacterium]